MARPAGSASSASATLAQHELGGKATTRAAGGTSSSGQFARTGNPNLPDPARVEPRAFDPQAAGVRLLARISLSPGSEMLETTHAFATTFTGSRLNPQVTQRVSVAAYELLANAFSYSTMGEDISFELFEDDRQIAIRVSNQTIAARISMLSDHIAKVKASPEQTLTEEMRRSVSGGPRPMLGLARVVHEAGLSLDLATDARRVTVTASCRR
jgi:hypothetical protein